MAAAAASEPSCPSLHYPRTLTEVLAPADRAHAARIYFQEVHGRSDRRYYNLLHHLAADKEDAAAWRIVEQVNRRIRREFGEGFVIANDFFSYRSPHVRLFPSWHQDGEFWMTADDDSDESCRGFNLWILLAHQGMNYSFDIVDVATHRWFYDALYARQFRHAAGNYTTSRPLFSPTEAFRRSRQGLRGFVVRGEGRSPPRIPRPTNVPLDTGSALVVRQIELHRTDDHPLSAQQWRLALGFKVLKRRKVVRGSEITSPFGHDAASVGAAFPVVYERARLHALDPAAQRAAWAAWLLGPDGGRLAIVAPLGLLACAAWVVRCRRASAGARAFEQAAASRLAADADGAAESEALLTELTGLDRGGARVAGGGLGWRSGADAHFSDVRGSAASRGGAPAGELDASLSSRAAKRTLSAGRRGVSRDDAK